MNIVTQAIEYRQRQEALNKLASHNAQQIDDVDLIEELADLYPEWSADEVYYGDKIKIVRYNDSLYRCLTAHTSQVSWPPDVAPALWVAIADPAIEWPDWVQPGGENPYTTGAKVTHKGKRWINNLAVNTWEPGVYGWDEVI